MNQQQQWKSSLCYGGPLETSCTGLLCPMVLFGHTHAKYQASDGDSYPSWIPFACGYIGSYALGISCFVAYGAPLLHALGVALTDNVVQPAASACGSLCLGLYAGNKRSVIRQKYNIKGSQCEDFAVHSFVSPCALCQESIELDMQTRESVLISGEYIPVSPMEPFKC